MATRRLPNSTPAVLRVLQTAYDTCLNTPKPLDRAITPEQFAQLDLNAPGSLLSRFLKEVGEADVALAAQAPLTTALSREAARLTMYVSHFHQVLDLGILREDFAGGARSYYGRDVTATALPDLTTYDSVAAAAQKIVDGEAARQLAEGAAFRPMSLPTAAEVGAVLTAFKAARAASQQAQVKTELEREDVAALYPTAQELAVDLCDTVEFFYRKDPDASSRRAKCSRWGVVYFYDTPATPTPTPAPVTPPTPTPPQG
jgi:hypothetical protein